MFLNQSSAQEGAFDVVYNCKPTLVEWVGLRQGNLWNNVFSTQSGQELSFAEDNGIVVPTLYWLVLDFSKFRRTQS